jgi:hypothetical protein
MLSWSDFVRVHAFYFFNRIFAILVSATVFQVLLFSIQPLCDIVSSSSSLHTQRLLWARAAL